MKIALASMLAMFLVATAAHAAIQTKEVEYKQGDAVLKGFLAWDDAAKEKRPGLVIVHEWWGHNEHARTQAKRFAAEGFVAFALDMYGAGKLASHPKDATAFMQAVMKDPAVLKARFNAAYDIVKADPHVDAARIGAAGYCMGGTIALTMARAGADMKGVATFHAGLKPVEGKAAKGNFKAKVIVATGGADPMIPVEQVAEFEKEMKDAGVEAEVKTYAAARHAFTNPDADKAGMDALKYDAAADKDSFEKAVAFLKLALK